MALIEYIEPVNAGTLFIGIGSLVITIVIAWLLYRFFKPVILWAENLYHKDMKYSIVEEKMLDEVAKEKGIDLDSEFLKRRIVDKPKRSFRRKIEDRVFDKMFPEEKEKQE